MYLEIGFFGEASKLARWHEMGAGNLPKRSHLYKIYESSEFQAFKNSAYVKKSFLNSIYDGLKAIGELFVNYYKNYVLSGQIRPALKFSTIKAKEKKGSVYSDIPLVDTGKMINLIEFRIVA